MKGIKTHSQWMNSGFFWLSNQLTFSFQKVLYWTKISVVQDEWSIWQIVIILRYICLKLFWNYMYTLSPQRTLNNEMSSSALKLYRCLWFLYFSAFPSLFSLQSFEGTVGLDYRKEFLRQSLDKYLGIAVVGTSGPLGRHKKPQHGAYWVIYPNDYFYLKWLVVEFHITATWWRQTPFSFCPGYLQDMESCL